MQLPDALLGPGLKIFLKIHHKKFLIFQEIELSCSNIFFSKFIFQQMEILKKLLTLHPKLRKKIYKSGNGNSKRITYIFSKGNCSYISGNGTFLYLWKGIFRTLAYLELEAYPEH